jgi:hypothetical protein
MRRRKCSDRLSVELSSEDEPTLDVTTAEVEVSGQSHSASSIQAIGKNGGYFSFSPLSSTSVARSRLLRTQAGRTEPWLMADINRVVLTGHMKLIRRCWMV